jgi:hypothetical protein
MFDAWFTKQVDECNDHFAQQWELLTLDEAFAPSSRLAVESLDRAHVRSWLEAKLQDLNPPRVTRRTPHPRLL